MKSPQEVSAIIGRLKELYPDAACSLDYDKDYELLSVSYTHLTLPTT